MNAQFTSGSADPGRALAITGPRSSRHAVQEFLATGGHDVLHHPKSEEVEAALSARPYRAVALFGGDGTLNRHLRQLSQTRLPVLIVPTGSGNDFALAAGLHDARTALQLWRQTWPALRSSPSAAESSPGIFIREYDLAEVTFADGTSRLFSCCLNVGLDADAARRTNLLPVWLKSRGGYLIGGLAALLNYRHDRISLSGAGVPLWAAPEKQNTRTWFVSVSNTPTFGGGLKIAPGASVTDGLLDVTVVGDCARWQMIAHFPKILSGSHLGLPMVNSFTASELRIETPHPQPVFADGEYLGQTPCDICINSKAIRVLSKNKASTLVDSSVSQA